MFRANRFLILLGLAGCLVYGQTLAFPFVRWDDPVYITENPFLNPMNWQNFQPLWLGAYKGVYMPLIYSFWGLILAVFGMKASAFHLLNILFHFINTYLVFQLIKKFLHLSNESTDEKYNLAAWMGSALFCLHPIAVESVAWVSGFKELGFTFFALLCLITYFEARQGSYKKTLLCFLSLVCAGLCQPFAITLPFIVFLFELLLSKRSLSWLRIFTVTLIGGLFILAIGVYTKNSQPDVNQDFVPPFIQRFEIAIDSLSFYVQKVAIPFPLINDYGRTPQLVLEKSWAYFGGLYLAFTIICSGLIVKKKMFPLFLVLFFATCLLPVLGFIPFTFQNYSTVSDRYAYFALVPVAILVAYGIDFQKKFVRKHWMIYSTLGIVLTFSVFSFFQTQTWSSSETLSRHALAHNNKSFASHFNLGLDYKDQGNNPDAYVEFKKASDLRPIEFIPYINIAILAAQGNELNIAEEYLKKALAIRPGSAEAHLNYAKVLNMKSQPTDAIEEYRAAISFLPASSASASKAHNDLGRVLAMQHEMMQAAQEFRKAIEIDPTNSSAQQNLNHALSPH